jgi:hypothetical protein
MKKPHPLTWQEPRGSRPTPIETTNANEHDYSKHHTTYTGYTHTPTSTSAKSVRLASRYRSALDSKRRQQQNSNCMFEQRASNRTQAPIIHRRCGDSGLGNVEWETTVRPQATNAASPREGGTSEVHRPQHSQQAAASAHPQAGSDRTPPHLRGGIELTN